MSTDLALFDIEPLVAEAPPAAAEPRTIDERFADFHAANPWVATALERLTADYLQKNPDRLVGMKMLFEVLRWQYDRQTTGDPFKVNNDFTSRYARLLIDRRPEWAAVFRTRELRTREES